MDHISSHIGGPMRKKDRATERGELMEYFLKKLNLGRARDGLAAMTMPRMGRVLVAIPTNDLYYLQSICDQARDFSKKFWWEVNPKNHVPADAGGTATRTPPKLRSVPPATRVSRRDSRSLY